MQLGPVTVVIASYKEAATIGSVLSEIPENAGGAKVSALVIVDGPDDGTAGVVAACGASVCVTGVNRGQGAALRLGYEIAAANGAEIIATIDADGQYDPRELERVVQPILEGQADFVSGSRRLGTDDTGNALRGIGVVVFARLISLLTRHRVTDPANGLRAMTAEVPSSLTLREDQYQASELLVGAILHGYRVIEKPNRMRARPSGRTRKGNSLRYGFNFARVIIGTWLRER